MPIATPRRRPGVRFDPPTPIRASDLPRMDVAAFVGFAASGPLHVPVVVESAVEFEEIFGGDLVLGESDTDGEPVIAQLPPAVRSFFGNGGRRCWVVRVAFTDEDLTKSKADGLQVARSDAVGLQVAQFDGFPLHGVLAIDADGRLSHRPLTLDARAEGAWADGALLTSTLIAEALATSLPDGFIATKGEEQWLTLSPPQTLAPGDLIRITTPDGIEGWCFVAATKPPDGERTHLEWRRGPELWWTCTPRPPAPGQSEEAPPWFTRAASGEPGATATTLDLVSLAPQPTVRFLGAQIFVETDDPRAATLRPGTPLELSGVPSLPLWWLFLTDVTATAWTLTAKILDLDNEDLRTPPNEPPPRWTVRWRAPETPGSDSAVEVVELAVAKDGWRVTDGRIAAVPVGAVLQLALDDEVVGHMLIDTVRATRWALRGDVRAQADEPAQATRAVWRVDRIALSLHTVDGAREARVDDLGFSSAHARPWTALPSDRQLFGPRPATEINKHEALWSDVRRPRLAVAASANVLHSLPIGLTFARPVTCTAVRPAGTAIEREGITTKRPDELTISPAAFLDRRFVSIAVGNLVDEVNRQRDEQAPARGLQAVLGIAEVTLLALPDAAWVGRRLRPPDPPTIEHIKWPPDLSARIRESGTFRRCGTVPPTVPGVPQLPRVPRASDTWRFAQAPTRDDGGALAEQTLELQRQAIRLCAARSDLTVSLSAPPELRARGVRRHVAELQRTHGVPRLDVAGPLWTRALSFACVHHPWLVVREGAAVRAVAPEGAVLGFMARRALVRGAWIAPAWEPLSGSLAVTPALSDAENRELLDARVNAIAPDPRGCVALDALTLSDDVDWTQLSVRRLIVLLRRAALARGERYVFEPMGGALRRSVQLGFETLLGDLFERGAFAGATASQGFRVTVLDTGSDDACLVVELRVAPAHPMRFITVRLVQRGDTLAVTEERAVYG